MTSITINENIIMNIIEETLNLNLIINFQFFSLK